MINLNFKIENPKSNRWDILWSKHGTITRTKAWEFNGYRTNSIVEVHAHYKLRCDHAGFKFVLSLFGYTVELDFYDIRHWDYKTNRWATL